MGYNPCSDCVEKYSGVGGEPCEGCSYKDEIPVQDTDVSELLLGKKVRMVSKNEISDYDCSNCAEKSVGVGGSPCEGCPGDKKY